MIVSNVIHILLECITKIQFSNIRFEHFIRNNIFDISFSNISPPFFIWTGVIDNEHTEKKVKIEVRGTMYYTVEKACILASCYSTNASL
jgi:hypothetical protein